MAAKPALARMTELMAPLHAVLDAAGLVAVPSDRRERSPNRAILVVMKPGLSKEKLGIVEVTRKHSGAILYKVTRPRGDDYDTKDLHRPDDVAAFLTGKVRKLIGTVSVTFDKASPMLETELRTLEGMLALRINRLLADYPAKILVQLEGGF